MSIWGKKVDAWFDQRMMGRRVKPWYIVVGAAIVTALLIVVPALPWSGDDAADGSSGSGVHVVVYEADGAGGAKSGTYTARSNDGGTVQGDADLPLMNRNGGRGLTFAGFRTGGFVYLSVQNKDSYGSVTCRIKVDGVVVSENTSDGAYVIASCQGRVP